MSKGYFGIFAGDLHFADVRVGGVCWAERKGMAGRNEDAEEGLMLWLPKMGAEDEEQVAVLAKSFPKFDDVLHSFRSLSLVSLQ